MRTLGLIGGMSAESTTVYYQTLTRLVRERLGGLHSAQLVLWSVDFAPIAELQAKDDWDATGREMADAARRLEAAGAQAILICANTMHLNAPQVEAAVGAPLIHIADATAQALKARGVTNALLLATRFTMEKRFYRERLEAAGLGVLTPEKADRDRLHAIIYDELVLGVISEASRAEVLAMIEKGRAAGADGIIFGCTEIGLLLDPAEMPLSTVDTAIAHCEAAVEFALS
ncbi:aspartate/glutamate racemase family protein [Phenylobacterium sp.]|jgi:aspartate racemase|uniref:aspartate/glutamate racemase family protein n=1 Tax=Phenylobacterium sp. TaxID=1871053 RepID=UPI002E355842|nr:aspartate/glutamate racemase family protein [Phenylobacterium sp.]HEX4710414.1 aspartate/glutamate racemase family protein [Phenylobacterium sp.]